MQLIVSGKPLFRLLPPKLLMRMKLTACILLIAALQVHADGFSQKVTISGKNMTLDRVFEEIKQQTGYALIMNKSLFEKTQRVTLQVKDLPLTDLLDLCLKGQGLSYQISNRIIVITASRPVPPPAAAPAADRAESLPPPLLITGLVTDEDGVPLSGASVMVKGTQHGTTTDRNGQFSLSDVAPDALLEVSYTGYSAKTMKVADIKITKRQIGSTSGNVSGTVDGGFLLIRLKPATSELDQVQIIAYGQTTRRLNTGDVTKVTSEELARQPVSNPLLALEGRVPGMVVTETSGLPGATVKVQLRGRQAFDTYLTNDAPLFIIDGVPMAAGNDNINQVTSALYYTTGMGLSPFASVNLNDIESIEVLKDADATAIYGSRGANGVILITTKKGKIGNTKLDVNVYTGASKVTRTVKMMNTQQYLQMRREAFANDNKTMTSANAYDLLSWDTTRYTDFNKLLIGGTAHMTDAEASLSGGNTLSQYLVGANFHRQSTVYPGNMADQRGTLHFNVNSSSKNKKFNMGLTGSYTTDNNNLTSVDLSTAMTLPPNFRIYDSVGKLAWNEGGITTVANNPLASILQQPYKATTGNLLGSMQLNYRLFDGFTVRTSLGYNSMQVDETRKNPKGAQNPATATTGTSVFATNQLKSWIAEPQMEYLRQLGGGKLDVLAGATFNEVDHKAYTITASGYTNDQLLGSISGASAYTATNTLSTYKYQAFFGRINYNWEDKYVLNLSGRRDGSSRFGADYRFSNFGAAGAAWLFSNEAFMKKLPVLSFGKLRGSYGVTGNDKIGEYQYLDSWTATTYPYTDTSALAPTRLYNPYLHWEGNKKIEVALELGFLQDRILTTVAVYRGLTYDPLVSYPLPAAAGFTTITSNLQGVVLQNDGIDITLSTINIRNKSFEWRTSFNMTIPKSFLKSYPNLSTSSYATTYFIGKSLNLLYSLTYTGVDSATGLYTIKDVNKDGKIVTADDFQVHGNLDPKLYGGMQNSVAYKNFRLDFSLQYMRRMAFNWKSFNGYNEPGSMYNQPTLAQDRWRKPGDKTDVQKSTLSAGSLAGVYSGYYSMMFSDNRYSDASYIRLKNLAISYELPAKKWLGQSGVTSCRVYLQAQNLLTFTGYKGGDPETLNYLSMPPMRTFTAGLQVKL